MKKRLLTVFLALLLVVSLGALPARAADVFAPASLFEAFTPAAAAPSDGASVMTGSAFKYLKNICMSEGTLTDGTDYVVTAQETLDSGAVVAFVLDYNTDYNEILIGVTTQGLGYDGIVSAMEIKSNAEAPYQVAMMRENAAIGLGTVYYDFQPEETLVSFDTYVGDAADREALEDFNSECVDAILGFLYGLLEDSGYTLEDFGLTAAARYFGVENQTPFLDVRMKDFYYKPVIWALNNGITKGVSYTSFAPKKTCTRGEVVTFLWRAQGKPEPTISANQFVDVKAGKFYAKAVLWAVEKGITKGTDATHFSPEQECTRAQVVTFLARAQNGKPTSTQHSFTDIRPGAFYYNAVLWAVEKGITNGVSPTRFGPNESCTRGQIVTFLWRSAGSPAV